MAYGGFRDLRVFRCVIGTCPTNLRQWLVNCIVLRCKRDSRRGHVCTICIYARCDLLHVRYRLSLRFKKSAVQQLHHGTHTCVVQSRGTSGRMALQVQVRHLQTIEDRSKRMVHVWTDRGTYSSANLPGSMFMSGFQVQMHTRPIACTLCGVGNDEQSLGVEPLGNGNISWLAVCTACLGPSACD